ncbi:MAG: NAD(P)/FAD-dependent oxidoreductase [Kiloniellales bacterium]
MTPTTASSPPRPRSVAVIGAGAVGLSCALYLQRDGHRVTLIDPRPPGTATSFGNAGGVVTGACVPTAMPGILREVPGMLLDPLGPFTIRWRYLPRLAPWLLRFVAASRPAQVEAISIALAELTSRVNEPWRDLAAQVGMAERLRPVGWLRVYDSDAGFAGSAAGRALMDRRGLTYQVLNQDELRQLEPALAPVFRHAWFQHEAYYVTNPGRVLQAFAADFAARGGRILRAEVRGFALDGTTQRLVTDQGAETAEAIVLAAGAWSRPLARQLGVTVSLETERGYHIMLPTPEPNLRRPVLWGEKAFVLGPMEEGVRLNSQVELAGLEAPPDYRRIRALLPLAKRMLPSLALEERSIWLGYRPSTPDSKPVIGPLPGRADVFLAFGHGHLGLTLGPLTGRLIADLVAARDSGFDLSPFRPDRW